jgi:hypothetical protein
MELSSPWPATNDIGIAKTIWPSIAAAWTEKQKWVLCTELSDAVQSNGNMPSCVSVHAKSWVEHASCFPGNYGTKRDRGVIVTNFHSKTAR